ncbi:MAG TPA: hypothetical protein VGE05_00695 [Novosphingobium sp.]
MLRRSITLGLLVTLLSGCSYSYDVLAVARGGQIAFIVDPKSSSSPTCIRRIEVYAEVERATVWRESVDYDDDCANEFPIAYGASFKGRHQEEWPTIPASALRRGVVYEVSTTTGATGYGGGRFVIKTDGRVENLQPSAG